MTGIRKIPISFGTGAHGGDIGLHRALPTPGSMAGSTYTPPTAAVSTTRGPATPHPIFAPGSLVDRAVLPDRIALPADHRVWSIGRVPPRPERGTVLVERLPQDSLTELVIWGLPSQGAPDIAARVETALSRYFSSYDGKDYPWTTVHLLPTAAGAADPLPTRVATQEFLHSFDLRLYEAYYPARTKAAYAKYPPILRLVVHHDTADGIPVRRVFDRHPLPLGACYLEHREDAQIVQRYLVGPRDDGRRDFPGQAIPHPVSPRILLTGTRGLAPLYLYAWGFLADGKTLPAALFNRTCYATTGRNPMPPAQRWRGIVNALGPVARAHGVALPDITPHIAARDMPSSSMETVPPDMADIAAEFRRLADVLAAQLPQWQALIAKWCVARVTAPGTAPACGTAWASRDLLQWILTSHQRMTLNMLRPASLRSAVIDVVGALPPEEIVRLLACPTQAGMVDGLVTCAILRQLTLLDGADADTATDLREAFVLDANAPTHLPHARNPAVNKALHAYRRQQREWLQRLVAMTADGTGKGRARQRAAAVARAMQQYPLDPLRPGNT